MMTEEVFLQKYTRHLNDNQIKAIKTVDGPVLLLAVPGSGKTTVLVNRLGYMMYVKGISPDNILTLTYTVAATHDMSKRFDTIFGEEQAERPEFRTINGICAKVIFRYGKMIGKEPFKLLSDETSVGKILAGILQKYMSEYPTETDIKNVGVAIAYCKNMLLADDEIEEFGKEIGIELLKVYKDYNDHLKTNHLMDYDDQMVYAYRMLKSSPELLRAYKEKYKYVCVDEAQDTSKIQHMIIDLISGADGNLFMVGDEDQSIYGFRAAYPEALLNFERNHPNARVLVMDQNYRSNAKIVAAADAFIKHNKERHDKSMVAVRGAGSDINYISVKARSNQYGYLTKVAADCRTETAVLYRDNECALPLIDRLDRQGIPYRIKSVDMAFFTSRVVTDVVNILKFALDPRDTDLFMRIYFKCNTFLKKKQAEEMCRMSKDRNISVLEAVFAVEGYRGMLTGKCKALQTNLNSMLSEAPSKALFRIENPCGYGEYLERNNMDTNKLFILKQLAYEEASIISFLSRLEYLQDMLKNSEPDYDCPFILSTIHSSKGLEYDRVYLMDVCNGVFPRENNSNVSSAEQDKKDFEEERRLFYVGMTRAKNELNIFEAADQGSRFIRELKTPFGEKKQRESTTQSKAKKAAVKQIFGKAEKTAAGTPVSKYELVRGECVATGKYGRGVVIAVQYDNVSHQGFNGRFTVQFDSGEVKSFLYPLAFKSAVRLESGEKIEIRYI